MKASSLALALLAAVLPELAAAQGVLLGSEREPGGTVLGRVCLDLDRDGRCGDDEPGVAGARVVAEDGAIALADGRGRYHLLERQTRIVLRDRAAYGGHVVAAEGLGVRRAFELAPAGAASIDLPVPPPAAEPPALAPAQPDDPGLTDAPARRDDGLLGWTLAGRVPPGATLTIAGAAVEVAADGAFRAEVGLGPGENVFPVTVLAPRGGVAVLSWSVHRVPRARGGDLILPATPVRLAAMTVAPAAGGGALVHGVTPPGTRVAVAGLAPVRSASGAFAAYVPASAEAAHIELQAAGAPTLATELPLAPARGLRAVAALADLELSFGGDAGVLVTARGAGAASGTAGPIAYAAGVDVDDRERSLADLARPRDALVVEHALDPERSFLATGDDAAAGDSEPGTRADLGARRSARRAARFSAPPVPGSRARSSGATTGRSSARRPRASTRSGRRASRRARSAPRSAQTREAMRRRAPPTTSSRRRAARSSGSRTERSCPGARGCGSSGAIRSRGARRTGACSCGERTTRSTG